MKRVRTAPGEGRKYQSKHGKFYIGWGGRIYAFHLAMGRLDISFETSRKKRAQLRSRRESSAG